MPFAPYRRLALLTPALSLALGLAVLPRTSQAIEEPAYELVRTIDRVEIRRYAPYVVAEVVIDAPADEAGSRAFPILAGYIFGKNKGERKFAMTAPVTQTAAPVKMAMTAPVTQAAAPGGGQRVQFVLPSAVRLADAPEPIDPRVQLREEPATTWAVIRYSGTWSESNYQQHLGELRASLKSAGVATEGEPVLARYDPPITPWFLRRNEIWLAVR